MDLEAAVQQTQGDAPEHPDSSSTTALAIPQQLFAQAMALPPDELQVTARMSSLSATEPSTTALALPPTQYASGLATEHSNSSDMDSEVVVSVIP